MKKLVVFFLVLFLLPLLVEAKNINLTRTDFNIESKQIYRLEQGDGISFIKDNKEYVISVDEIGKSSIRLKSFAYQNDTRETFYILLNTKYSNKIDFERDDINDMKLDLLKIWNMNDTIKADILFEALNEPKTPVKTETVSNTNNSLKTGLIITASIVLLGLLGYFGIKKKIIS